MTRKEFLGISAASLAGATQGGKRRVALAGTGSRGSSAWGRELLREHGERVEMVALYDINPKRLEAARRIMGTSAPVYTDLAHMIREAKPELVIVATKDSTHHEVIIRALELGCDVLTEKPMTIDAEKCQAVLDAEKRTGRKITVAFNYRYSPTAQKLKELLLGGAIGEVVSLDFHWYLDTSHGADYFRRWHAKRENSNTLFVHKATHHFDLVNWYLDAEPVEVHAYGTLRHYGRNGAFRGPNCRACDHKAKCSFFMDMTKRKEFMELYANAESVDGYLRDACVFRQDIDIFDTMTAEVRYTSGALMSYSLNACMPVEGYHLAFNGKLARLELRQYERQPWEVPAVDEIRLTKNFGGTEVIRVEHGKGGHFGGDPALRRMLFVPGHPDPLRQRAGSRAGAMSLLTGAAAVRSVDSGRPVRIADLVRF